MSWLRVLGTEILEEYSIEEVMMKILELEVYNTQARRIYFQNGGVSAKKSLQNSHHKGKRNILN